MRSSRRKRSQYVITLREEVAGLQRRRREAQEERALLGQLTHLWQRLCDEVEAEIQEGVRRQLGIQVSEDAKCSIPRLRDSACGSFAGSHNLGIRLPPNHV